MTASMRDVSTRTAVTVGKISKGTRVANKVLLFCAVYLILFTVAETIVFCITGQEQTELVSMTFTVFGVELGGLLAKRIAEKVFGKNKDTEE